MIRISTQRPYRLSLPDFFKLFFVTLSIFSLVWVGQKFSLFPIRYVKIVGSHSAELNTALKQTIEPLLKDKTHRINLQMLESQLKQWSCVEKIVLWPILPYTLMVYVRVREPIALFRLYPLHFEQPIQWTDRTGFLFQASPHTVSHHLPTLIGPREKSQLLVKYYRMLSIILKSQSLRIESVQLDTEERCSVKLTNGIQLLLGHINPLEQLQKLVKTHPFVLHQAEKIATLDLRYPNGMAITWREGVT